MYSYTHIIASGLIRTESGAGGSTYDVPATEAGESAAGATTQTGLISASYSGQASFDGNPFPIDSGFSYTSYSYGTRPRSVVSISGTTADNTITGTISIFPTGSSTGIDSFTYTDFSTVTSEFTQIFRTFSTSSGSGTSTSSGISVLSGTASATSKATNSTMTFTLSEVTTLVPVFAESLATVQRWYVDRQHPFGTDQLRSVAIAFAPTHVSGQTAIVSLNTGANTYASDLSFSTTNSSSSFGFTSQESNAAQSENRRTGETYVTGIDAQKEYWFANDVLIASRKAISGNAFIASNSLFSSINFNSTISADWTNGVSVAFGIKSASIFTNLETVDSTTFQWKYSSSSWILHATSTNTSTSSTYTISLSFDGAISTSSENAMLLIGCTTALRGPYYPFTVESLNEISVSTIRDDTDGKSAYYSSVVSSLASSESTIINSSSSITTSFSSSDSVSGFSPMKFENSLLSWAVANIVASISTNTWSTGYAERGVIPSIYQAAKWNEASRGDPVIVNQ